MEYFEYIMFWSGVVLWIVCIAAALMVFGALVGMNIPRITKAHKYTLYNFGIGQCVVLRDEEVANRMEKCGFIVHKAERYWWALKIFRVQL